MQFIALSWYITEVFKEPRYIGLLVFIGSISAILIAPLSGYLADNTDNKQMVVISDLLRFCILLLLIIIVISEYLSNENILVIIYIVEFTLSVGSAIFYPSFISLIQKSFKDDEYISVTSYNSIALQIGVLVGTAISGVIVGTYGITTVFIINAVTYLLSGMSLMLFKEVKNDSLTHYNNKQGFTESLKKSWSLAFTDPLLFYLIMLGLLPSLAIKIINVFLSGYSLNVLHSNSTIFGILDATFAIGAIFWSYILKKSIRAFNFKNIWIYQLIMGIMFIVLAVSSNIFIAILGMFIFGGASILLGNVRRVFLLKYIPRDTIGSLESLNSLLYSILIPVISLFISNLTNINTIGNTFFIVGCVYIIFSIVISVINKQLVTNKNIN